MPRQTLRRRRRSQEEGWLLSYADLITNLLIFFVAILAASQISPAKFQRVAEQLSGRETRQSLKEVQRQIEDAIEELDLGQSIRTRLNDDGLKIAVDTGVMFETGKAEINGEWLTALSQVIDKLVPYSQSYHFAVEGHTDSRPINSTAGSGRFESNWELASARAAAIRKRLELAGIPPNRTRLESYADTVSLPAADLEGLSEDESFARHRRVVVRIY